MYQANSGHQKSHPNATVMTEVRRMVRGTTEEKSHDRGQEKIGAFRGEG